MTNKRVLERLRRFKNERSKELFESKTLMIELVVLIKINRWKLQHGSLSIRPPRLSEEKRRK